MTRLPAVINLGRFCNETERRVIMAKRLPDYQEKQKILYGNGYNRDERIFYGDALFAAGHIFDALDFYERAGFAEGLEKIKIVAEREGDAMLYQQVHKAMGKEISAEQWEIISTRAGELGKLTFSLYALNRKAETSPIAALKDGIKGDK